MVVKLDLHVHSNASDGMYSPERVVDKAAALNIKVLALTDHDTVAGINPAIAQLARYPELYFIPGIEISTSVPSGEVHILGYFVDYLNEEFSSILERQRNARVARAKNIIGKLRTFGIKIEWERVKQIADGGNVGRPHIARAMLENGSVSTFKQAFDEYLGHGKPAYLTWEKMTPGEAIEVILKFGGLPVMAHPLTANDPEKVISGLLTHGLAGIEVYYNNYPEADRARMLALADKYHLIATGGSDYHGIAETEETMIGSSGVPLKAATDMIKLAKERALPLLRDFNYSIDGI